MMLDTLTENLVLPGEKEHGTTCTRLLSFKRSGCWSNVRPEKLILNNKKTKKEHDIFMCEMALHLDYISPVTEMVVGGTEGRQLQQQLKRRRRDK